MNVTEPRSSAKTRAGTARCSTTSRRRGGAAVRDVEVASGIVVGVLRDEIEHERRRGFAAWEQKETYAHGFEERSLYDF